MHGTTAIRPFPLAGLCALAIAALLIWVLPASAQASVVGPDGQISSCYKKKGKGKGTLRVVPAGKRCRKGERKLTWNAQGPPGQTGGQGGTGATGGSGDNGLQSQITDLKNQVTQLTSQLTALTGQVATLQGILSGVSNGDLLGALASVDSLCGQVGALTTQSNGILTGLGAPSLTGTLLSLGNLGLSFPSLPSSLGAFSCP